MSWIETLFSTHSAVQGIVILSLICGLGLFLGKIRIMGISLGVAFVFFIGILAGHFGLSIDAAMADYAESFGLTLFVYTLGLYVGPNFFSSMKHEGVALNLWSLAIIAVGIILTLALCRLTPVEMPEMVGLLCGATTNTPALGAAQQALGQIGQPGQGAALACAVTYPLGVIGVILAILLMRKLFVKKHHLNVKKNNEGNTFIAQFIIVNPAVAGKTVAQISQMTHLKFVISRIWRNNQVLVPLSTTQLQCNDSVLVVMNKDELQMLEILFGEKVDKDWNKTKIDWNAIDSNVESRVIIVTRPELNGKRLGQLQLRHIYGVNVSRIWRAGIKLLATDDLRLQYGDRVTVVGEHEAIKNVEKIMGNAVQTLNEPNLAAIFLGLLIGLALGTLPLTIPGISIPIRLGLAGGPIIVGILIGALGARVHIISYTTRSASLMLRKLGLSLYLSCLGLDAGKDFFTTVIRPEGALWVGIGFLLTILPVLIVGWIALRTRKLDFGTICGIVCGSMANPMALAYANDTVEGDTPSVSYATVYPISMFLRVIIAQILIMTLA